MDSKLFVPHGYSLNVTVVDALNRQSIASIPLLGYSWLQSAAYDPSQNLVFISGWTQELCTGCSATWVVALSGSNDSVAATYQISGIDSYHALFCLGFDPQFDRLYACDVDTGELTVLNATTLSKVDTIPVGTLPSAIAFDPATGEGYVANLGSNDVTVFQTQTGRVTHTIAVGTQPDALAYDTRTGELFVANNGSANLTVIDGTTDRVVGSVRVGSCPIAEAYDQADGALLVANACSDTVSVIDATARASTDAVPVGVYPCGLALDPTRGTLYVANEGSANITVLSSSEIALPVLYPVTFLELGLPTGTNWSIALAGTTSNSNSDRLTFHEPNGTYDYAVPGVPGWRVPYLHWNGSVLVGGSGVNVTVNWTAATWPVGFTEKGLPGQATWTVVVGPSTKTSSFADIVLELPNGTYAFSITSSATGNARPDPAQGTLRVAAAAVSISVTFTSPVSPSWEDTQSYWLAVGIAGGLLGGGGVLAILYFSLPDSRRSGRA